MLRCIIYHTTSCKGCDIERSQWPSNLVIEIFLYFRRRNTSCINIRHKYCIITTKRWKIVIFLISFRNIAWKGSSFWNFFVVAFKMKNVVKTKTMKLYNVKENWIVTYVSLISCSIQKDLHHYHLDNPCVCHI